ncbi:MAG TPA: branched-chain amino acid ABC transporter permease [Propionibacterium sp.]|nr:branched-chain amino acid ABC transporter permease [Propionibacterium sp.]
MTDKLSGRWGYVIGAAVVLLLVFLPLLNIPGLGILPGPTYTAGSMHLMAFTMLMVALALTYHLLFGVAGLLSFGHALYFSVGVYGLAIVMDRTDIPLVPAALLVIVIGIAVANVLGAISLRVSGISFAMVTLAFAQAANVLVRRNPGRVTGGDEGLSLRTAHVPDFLVGVVNTRNLYWVALAVLVVVYLITVWLENSRLGHSVAAVRENETRVRVLGGRPYLVKLITFAVAGTLATFVGIVYLLLQSGASHTATGTEFTLSLLVMVVLGGVGKRWGAILGAVVYTLLDQRLVALAQSPVIANLPPFLHIPLSEPMFLLGTLFILVVIFLPGGLTSALERVTRRRTQTVPHRVLEDVT